MQKQSDIARAVTGQPGCPFPSPSLTQGAFGTQHCSREAKLGLGPPHTCLQAFGAAVIEHCGDTLVTGQATDTKPRGTAATLLCPHSPWQPLGVTSAKGLSQLLHWRPMTPGRQWQRPVSLSQEREVEPTG